MFPDIEYEQNFNTVIELFWCYRDVLFFIFEVYGDILHETNKSFRFYRICIGSFSDMDYKDVLGYRNYILTITEPRLVWSY